ncbi:MAG: hypothetical protein AAFR60_06410 [Pseudomonadota bacterium]
MSRTLTSSKLKANAIPLFAGARPMRLKLLVRAFKNSLCGHGGGIMGGKPIAAIEPTWSMRRAETLLANEIAAPQSGLAMELLQSST